METVYSSYKDLPAYAIAVEKMNKLNEVYKMSAKLIKDELTIAEKEFVKERDVRRKQANFVFTVTDSTNENGTHYHITRKCTNPLEGDTDFYKDINYATFKIINNVFINTGSGYQLPIKNGDLVESIEVAELHAGKVPDRFKSYPKFTNEYGGSCYLGGT